MEKGIIVRLTEDRLTPVERFNITQFNKSGLQRKSYKEMENMTGIMLIWCFVIRYYRTRLYCHQVYVVGLKI